MPFLAILIDVLTAGAYYLQLQNPTENIRFLGMVVQGVLTLILLIMVFAYQGKRYALMRTNFAYRNLSIRYGIIVLSFIINGVVLFLYVLNYLGINDLIFSAF